MANEMVTFEVSDVPVERSELKRGSVAQVLGAPYTGRIERAIELDRGFAPTEEHPFLGAARHAFARHLPLRLRPDDVWLLLVQGFAQHVSIHAEELRGRLVSHAGKLTITVIRDEFVRGAPDNDWASAFPEFREQIREHVGARHDLIVGDFSTTSPTDRVVGTIALMDVMQHYFDFVVLTRCGIPRITLTGTPDDWRQIRERARVFAEFDLEWWCEPLEEALTYFVHAAEGRADRDVCQDRRADRWVSRIGRGVLRASRCGGGRCVGPRSDAGRVRDGARGCTRGRTSTVAETDLSASAPFVVYCGDLQVRGNLDFNGVLVVLGDLVVDGLIEDSYEWSSIWVTGSVRAKAKVTLRNDWDGEGFKGVVEAEHQLDMERDEAQVHAVLLPSFFDDDGMIEDEDEIVEAVLAGDPIVQQP